MKLATILPPSMIDWSQPGYHMVLGQWLVNDVYYRSWVATLLKAGSFVLVDNGAAEPEDERVTFEQIVEQALLTGIDEIIMPDLLYDGPATVKLTLDAISKYGDTIPPRMRMVVPQGRTWTEWMMCLRELLAEANFRTIGLPKHLEQLEGGRAHAIDILVKAGLTQMFDIHMLGLWKHYHHEIRSALEAYPGIRGIDSGAAIAFAQRGVIINENKASNGSVRYSLDNVMIPHRGLADGNIEILRGWCDNERIRTEATERALQRLPVSG